MKEDPAMRLGSATIRLVAGLALALGLAAALAPFAGGRVAAQDNGLASITIYTAICPTGYGGDQYFEDCYDTPGADIEFWLTGPAIDGTATATTDANGFTAFEGIDEDGLYTLQIQIPGDFTDFVAFCSAGGESFPFEDGDLYGEIDLDLTTSDDLRCDFYVIPLDQGGPTTAQLTIHNRVCPVEYAGTDFFNDCHGNPANGQDFFLEDGVDRQGTTDAAGDLTFTDLPPDTYFVFGGPPGDFILSTSVFCAPTATPGEPFPNYDQEDGEAGFTIALAAGDDVTCDFYSVPVNAQGETPTPAPTKAPATSTVATLPNTGVGPDGGSGGTFLPLAAAAILLVIGGAGLFATRARLSRAPARANR
jgi:hypothetical protein